MYGIALVSCVSIGILAILYKIYYPANVCDLTDISKRDFNHYYGLDNVDNPLSEMNAEEDNALNSKCLLFYDHLHLFSNVNHLPPKSMIVKALRGSGKSQIRQCLITKLSGSNQILMIHLTQKSKNFGKKEHFIQIILTELASRFTHEKYINILKEKVHIIPPETRREIAILLSFYSTKYPDKLCEVVNILLKKLVKCSFSFWTSCALQSNNLHDIQTNAEIFVKLTEKHGKVTIKRRTLDTDASLKLIQIINEKTKILAMKSLDRSYRDQLIFFIGFLNKLNIRSSIIVDSLDESNFFFDKSDPNLRTLQKIIDSITDDDILHLALGNVGGNTETPSSFSFYILIPHTLTVPMNISWTRPDKIPIIDLKWNELQLINYGDFIFEYLRKQSKRSCKKLPKICELLAGEEQCHQTMKQLRHPRDFHIFFRHLTNRLSTVCTQRNPPFIATKEDLEIILKETKNNILNESMPSE